MAQAVSSRLPPAAARVQTRVWSCGILWLDKSGAGAGFLREELRFPPANLHSICFSTIIFTIRRGWHNRPGVAAVPIASQTRIKKKKKTLLRILISVYLESHETHEYAAGNTTQFLQLTGDVAYRHYCVSNACATWYFHGN
jgi:hypothetical protein